MTSKEEETKKAAVAASVTGSHYESKTSGTDLPSYENMKPLQINDQCNVQFRGSNRNTTTATTTIDEGSNTSYITLPAVIIERRLARKNKQSVVPLDPKRNQSNKRLRTGSGSHNDSGTATGNSSGVVKKEMFDTLPADALEYYIHYVDHDRRLDEWVTLDRIKLETLRRHSHPLSSVVDESISGLTTMVTDKDKIDTDNMANDNNSTDGDNDNFSDSCGGNANSVRITRRHSSKSMSSKGDGKITAATNRTVQAHGTVATTTPAMLTGESDHGTGSVFSFRGGNWHASSGGTNIDPASAAFEREHEETTKVKNIETIVMGSWSIAAWYYSPFPLEYSDVDTLYVCEYCLSYMKKHKTLKKHKAECTLRQPPGREIYRHEDISVYELDGKEHRAYCQKLCLLAKLFLDHKTLYYDVTPFYFYVVTKVDCHGAHIVGYFSKEKVSNEGYNLACILTFPQYQQAGYGKFIISLSYELTKREGKTGSPEKPLSDLGKVSYRSYWTHVLMHLFANCDPNNTDITMNEISQQTGIKTEDIISTLQSLDMIKVWKGQHVVYVQQSIIEDYMKLNKKFRLCQSEYLKWDPPNGRQNKDPV